MLSQTYSNNDEWIDPVTKEYHGPGLKGDANKYCNDLDNAFSDLLWRRAVDEAWKRGSMATIDDVKESFNYLIKNPSIILGNIKG